MIDFALSAVTKCYSSSGGEFTVDFLQPGLLNQKTLYLCYLNSMMFLMHRIQIRFLLYDDHGVEDRIFGIFRYLFLQNI